MRKEPEDSPDLLMEFPAAMQTAGAKALSYLKNGAGALFDDQHQFMADVSIAFIAAQIGADIFLLNTEGYDPDASRFLD
jgi:hypothetical protein